MAAYSLSIEFTQIAMCILLYKYPIRFESSADLQTITELRQRHIPCIPLQRGVPYIYRYQPSDIHQTRWLP